MFIGIEILDMLAAAFIMFGVQKKIYKISKLVFIFYGAIFILSLFHAVINPYYFVWLHIVILLCFIFISIWKFNKYKKIIIFLYMSAFLIAFAFRFIPKYFYEIHFLVLVVDLIIVTVYVFKKKVERINV